MPNICSATITIKGYKDNVDEFIKILNADYNYRKMIFSHPRHFFRIFNCRESKEPEINGVSKISTCEIECAWSVYSCMFDGLLSYYGDYTTSTGLGGYEDKEFSNAVQEHATHILAEAKRLRLQIEITSEEPGMCFKEHYYISEGIKIIDEEAQYNEYWFEDCDTYEDALDYYKDLPLSKEEFENMKEAGENHYSPDENLFYPHENIWNQKEMCKNVMCKIVK